MRRYIPEERRPQLHHFESQESGILHVSFQAITANVVSELYDTVQGVSSAYGRNFSLCFVICMYLFFCASCDFVVGLLIAESTRK